MDDLIEVLRIFKSDPIIDQYQVGYRSGYMDGKLQEQILRWNQIIKLHGIGAINTYYPMNP